MEIKLVAWSMNMVQPTSWPDLYSFPTIWASQPRAVDIYWSHEIWSPSCSEIVNRSPSWKDALECLGLIGVVVKLLTTPTAWLKSPVRLGIAPPSKTGSLTQLTPSNPNSSLTRMTPMNLCKTLTHLTQSDPAKRIRSLIRTYGQTSFI